MNPVKLGITGGIGSGKSYVSGVLSGHFHIPVYNTDLEARRLMVESDVIRRGLVALLGESVYFSDGSLNKAVVSSYLFASPRHAAHIDALVHPVVRDDFQCWVRRQSAPCVAMECAILFESGFDRLVDRILLVRASEEVCLARAMRRDKASASQIKARMRMQMSDAERCARAHYVVNNDGDMDLLSSLEKIVGQLEEGM